tara:strand:+ start:3278 stop:3646 length:369 start_codon:yes stop_codon:yes gene_type:complete
MFSQNETPNSIGVKEQTILGVRCNNGKPSVIVYTPTFNSDNNRIGIRWDKDEAFYQNWDKASSSKSYFVPNPKKFIDEVKKRDFITIQWTPYQRASVAAKFDLNSQNFKNDIETSIKDGCNL